MTINLRVSDAIDEYMLHMHSTGAKPNTIKNHRQVLKHALIRWGNPNVCNLTSKHVTMFFVDTEWSPATRNLYLSNLRGGFFAWARRNNYMRKDFDPTDGWRNLKVTRRDRKWIPVEDFSDLLNAATTPRDRAIIALGLFTMCRAGEINSIKIGDVSFDDNTIEVYREKTEDFDTMPMSTELRKELLTWLAIYRERMGGELSDNWYLTPASKSLPMSYSAETGKLAPSGALPAMRPTVKMRRPYEPVKRALVVLGIDPFGSGVHLLRRSAGRALFNRLRSEGYDGALKTVSAMLGHKSVVMTEHYLGLEIERLQRNTKFSGLPLFPDMNAGATVTTIGKAV